MTIEERASNLLARLDREIERVEAGTVAVGGLTKAGNDLAALLKTTAGEYCRGQGTSLDAEIRAQRLIAGAGTYARILAGARAGTLTDRIGEALVRDIRLQKASRTLALVDLRNANSHDNGDLKLYKAKLVAMAALLRPLLVPRP